MSTVADRTLIRIKYDFDKKFGSCSDYKGSFYFSCSGGLFPYTKRTTIKERRALLNYSKHKRPDSVLTRTSENVWLMLTLRQEISFTLDELKKEYIDEDGKYYVTAVRPLIEGLENFIKYCNIEEEVDG